MNYEDLADEPNTIESAKTSLARQIADSISSLPMLSQLEFVRNVLFLRHGCSHSIPAQGPIAPCDITQDDPLIVGAVDILDGIIEAVKKQPKIAQLRTPNPC